jgi:hypothetical protein
VRVELVHQVRERAWEQLAALLVKGGIGKRVNVKVKEFEQFVPCRTALHGNKESQQGFEVHFTLS